MSLVLGLNDAATMSLRAVPIWLQEEVLDELERLADDPSLLHAEGMPPSAVFDFTRTQDGIVHYVFTHLEPDTAGNILKVLAIGHVTRPVSSSSA